MCTYRGYYEYCFFLYFGLFSVDLGCNMQKLCSKIDLEHIKVTQEKAWFVQALLKRFQFEYFCVSKERRECYAEMQSVASTCRGFDTYDKYCM